MLSQIGIVHYNHRNVDAAFLLPIAHAQHVQTVNYDSAPASMLCRCTCTCMKASNLLVCTVEWIYDFIIICMYNTVTDNSILLYAINNDHNNIMCK